MDYVKSIRAKLGHQKIILNCAGVVIEKDGRILFQRRSDNNRWGLIGGLLELDETYEEAAIREAKEETGLDVQLTAFLGIFHNHNMVWSNGDAAHTIGAYYVAEIVDGTPRIDAESLELRFCKKDEIPDLFAEDHRAAVRAFLDGVRLPLLNENNRSGQLDVTLFSKTYAVRRLTDADVPAVVALCKENPLFYQYCPPFVTEESIRKDMTALPPKKTHADKFYLGYFDGDRLIAVLDYIRAFPNEQTAFLGFFMVERSLQGHGVGTAIIDELCDTLKNLGVSSVRLGWVKGNPQSEHFWHKNRFKETGATYETGGYTVIVAQRELSTSNEGGNT